jgi:hypothetical protein
MSLQYLCLIRVCVSSLFGTCVAFRKRIYFSSRFPCYKLRDIVIAFAICGRPARFISGSPSVWNKATREIDT